MANHFHEVYIDVNLDKTLLNSLCSIIYNCDHVNKRY